MSQSAAYDFDPMWSHAWGHRDRLLRIARRRTMSLQEAEDVVSEVLLRAAERSALEDDALARWLTAVTLNICADVARERAQSNKRAAYSVRQLLPEPSPEQVVVDRETAATAVQRLSNLPDRQREALLLRSAGFGVDEIAAQLDVSYKTAESLLSRARAFMRKTVAVTATIVLGLLRGFRRHTKSAPVLTAAAVVFAVAIGTGAEWNTAGPPDAPAVKFGPALTVKVTEGPSRATPHTAVTHHHAQQPVSVAHRTTSDHPGRTLVPPARIRTRGPYAKTPGATYSHGKDSLLTSVARCLEQGPQLTPQMMGCPS